MKDIVFVILQRGVGTLVYAVCATRFLPAANIQRDIYLLTVVDFVLGMAIFPLRISALAHPEKEGVASGVAFGVAVAAAIAVLFFHVPLVITVLTLLCVAILPPLLSMQVALERKDVRELARIEARGALWGSVAAGLVLMILTWSGLENPYASPVLRPLLVNGVVLAGAIAISRGVHVTRPQFNRPGSLLFVLRGLDYVGALAMARGRVLASLGAISSGGILSGSELTKAAVILYDPLAAFFAYFLRFRFASLQFQYAKYAKSTTGLFLVVFGTTIVLAVVSYIAPAAISGAIVALAAVGYLLAAAGVTNHFALGATSFRTMAIFTLIGSALAVTYQSALPVVLAISASAFATLLGRLGRRLA